MEREILFRGKYEETGKWVYGCGFAVEGFIGKIFYYSDSFTDEEGTETKFYDSIEVETSTVGQYTGLTDKNGKKIFEGDIVEAIDYIGSIWFVGDKQKYVIKFIHGGFSAGNNRPLKDFVYGPIIDSSPIYEIEVIGNIHDNPELLASSD